jgi:hypothetical protein
MRPEEDSLTGLGSEALTGMTDCANSGPTSGEIKAVCHGVKREETLRCDTVRQKDSAERGERCRSIQVSQKEERHSISKIEGEVN